MTNESGGDGTVVETQRRLSAPPRRVFAAFSDPELVRRWLSPSPEIALTILQLDFRVGGTYRFAYHAPGREPMCVNGVYRTIEPPSAIAFSWNIEPPDEHAALEIYRSDIVIPFGFLAILIQAVIFSWVYEKGFAGRGGTLWSQTLAYAALGASLSWTYTTLAVAAKNVMTSVPDYLLIETAFTITQWAAVAPLTALAFRQPLAMRAQSKLF